MWHTAKYGDPYSEFVLCINASNVPTHISEHTHSVNTHTLWTHTPGAVGSHLCCGARGAVGVWCLTQGHLSRGIEGEVQLDIHSPHLQLPNSQPFDYESNSQTIRPWHVNIRLAKTNDQLVFNWLLKQHKEISCPRKFLFCVYFTSKNLPSKSHFKCTIIQLCWECNAQTGFINCSHISKQHGRNKKWPNCPPQYLKFLHCCCLCCRMTKSFKCFLRQRFNSAGQRQNDWDVQSNHGRRLLFTEAESANFSAKWF